jgi:hypothetical protein
MLETGFDFKVSFCLLWFTPIHIYFPHKKIHDVVRYDLPFGVFSDFSPLLLFVFLSFCVYRCLKTSIFIYI